MRMCGCVAAVTAVVVGVGRPAHALEQLALDGAMHPPAPGTGAIHRDEHKPSPPTPAAHGPAVDSDDGAAESTVSGVMLELAGLLEEKGWGVGNSESRCTGQGHDKYVLSKTPSATKGGGGDGRQGEGSGEGRRDARPSLRRHRRRRQRVLSAVTPRCHH